jgi:23S rRNA (cytosine1962-C5)-methyltransferase
MIDKLSLITSPGFPDYALLDSGGGRKLERFGAIIVDRPEPQALWLPARVPEWGKAHGVFSASGEDEEKGKWRLDKPVPDAWKISIPCATPASAPGAGDVTMILRLQGLWHLGLFPEQWPHWLWMLARIAEIKAAGETPRVLNLFAYTGAATLLAAAAGAEVTHVDASKKSVSWGRENQIVSKLEAAKIRWIVDDAELSYRVGRSAEVRSRPRR